ncbi:2-polyprenyl-6-methoxyphenol hydroxylase-like FAD-dependent oxidoreductase [Bradyrhizobium sp. USDA 4011]
MKELRIIDDAGQRRAGFGTRVFTDLTGGRYVTLQRSDLSRLLFEKLKGRIERIFDDEIIALEECRDCIRVELKYAKERRFDLVIGADGLHSVVRKLVFGQQSQFEKYLGYVVAALDARGYRPRDENTYIMYGQPRRMVGRFSLHDDRTLFFFVFSAPVASLPATLHQQNAMLRDVYCRGGWECPRILDELDRTDELYFDRVSQVRMQNWSRGRVALVGDAAFCVSLLAGQGSALAMISSYVLAGEFAAGHGQYQQAFGRYETLLRRYIAAKQRAAERFAGAFAPKTRFGLSFRDLVVRAFAFPGLARLAVGRDIADSVKLPDYSWSSLTQRAT